MARSTVYPNVAITNESTVVTDSELHDTLPHLQAWVDKHFRLYWDAGCRLYVGKVTHAQDWQIALLDDSDQAGALGYHETTQQGKPLGKVFAKTDLKYGLDRWVTLTHELGEMLGDPGANLLAETDDPHLGPFLAYEACDAVEDDSLALDLGNGIKGSNFVTPAWFMPGSTGPWDAGHVLSGPLQLASGGYIGVFDGKTWSQKTKGEVVRGGAVNDTESGKEDDLVLHPTARYHVTTATKVERRRVIPVTL